MIFIASSSYEPNVDGFLGISVFLRSFGFIFEIVPGTWRSRLLSLSLFTNSDTFFTNFPTFYNLGGDKFCFDVFDDVDEAPLEALEWRDALLRFSDIDMLLFFLFTYLLENYPSFWSANALSLICFMFCFII